MDNFRMGGKPWDTIKHNLIRQEVGVAGGFNGFISERVPGYIIGEPWPERCVVYDPILKRVTYLEHR